MKKIKLLFAVILFISIMVLNVIGSVNQKEKSIYNLNLLIKESKAYDLEEITITCNSGGWGYCYTEHWTGFGCVATGNPLDFCL